MRGNWTEIYGFNEDSDQTIGCLVCERGLSSRTAGRIPFGVKKKKIWTTSEVISFIFSFFSFMPGWGHFKVPGRGNRTEP